MSIYIQDNNELNNQRYEQDMMEMELQKQQSLNQPMLRLWNLHPPSRHLPHLLLQIRKHWTILTLTN